jgi:uncharacterized membrane protein YfcA
MDLYLPIAEMSVNLILLLVIGGGVGFVSGVFGVGGGFLMTPLLIFVGLPPTIAVGTGTLQILASSVSGVLAQLRRHSVDIKMGIVLVAGGFVGTGIGILLFQWIRALGLTDTFVTLAYVFFLGTIGAVMLVEGLNATWRTRRPAARPPRRLHRHSRLHRLPFKMRFSTSRLYISALVPIGIGGFVGILTAVMGVGGGFILVPAMIYLIGVPTAVVVGTSLFQLCFVAAMSAFLHATSNYNVDIVLGLLLIGGGAIGAQFGSRVGAILRGEQLRLLLALLVLIVCGRLAWDLVATPLDPFSIGQS